MLSLAALTFIGAFAVSAAFAQIPSAATSTNNAPFWGAFIAVLGSVIVLGLGKLLEIWIDLRRRHQRRIDLLCALHAEILAGVGAGREQLAPGEQTYALNDASPFATPDDTDFVFSAVKSDLSILPLATIHSVVGYYRKAMQTNATVRDFRDPLFLTQSDEQKRKFVAQFLSLTKAQDAIGQLALEDIETCARGLGLELEEKRTGSRKALEPGQLDLGPR